jgi:cullin-4
MNEEKENNMIQELLDLKINLDNIMLNCFQSNSEFLYTLKLSFEFFINQKGKQK